MPNLFSANEINKGYFLESDKNIAYETYSDRDIIEHPENTITQIGYTDDKSFIYFKLLNESLKILSLLRVEKKTFCAKEFYQINKIYSVKKRNGYAKYLYNIALIICDSPLISDKYLTRPGSYNVWESLIEYRNVDEYEVHYINIADCETRKYNSSKPETFYWGYDQEKIEVYREEPDNLEYQLDNNFYDEETYLYLKNNLRRIQDKTNIRFIMIKKT